MIKVHWIKTITPGNIPARLAMHASMLLFALLSACGVGHFIPEDETLYTGAEIKMEAADSVRKSGKVRKELETLLRPRPNSRFLGMRPGLYFHYKAQQEHPSFLYKWLNKKFGEDPVYFSEVEPGRMEDLLRNRLDNRGYFYSQVSPETDSTRKYASLKYSVNLHRPYTMAKLELAEDSLQIYKAIDSTLGETLLKPGQRYNLDRMKFERERIDRELKQKGYYNFNPDFLIFEADTNRYANKQFDLLLRLKKDTPQKSVIPYTIDSISVFPNYSIEGDSLTPASGKEVDGIDFFQKEEFFKPEKLEPYILIEEGQPYNAETAHLTSNLLSALGSYKFVNLRFHETDTLANDGKGSLRADIFLSPLNKRSIRAQIQAVTKSNGFAGPGVAVTYNNRNLFKGGENLSITGNFAYEAQISGGGQNGLTGIAAGLKADLVLPRFILLSPEHFTYAVPKTKFSLGGDILKRSKLYSLASSNATYGYTWNENRYVYHELDPVSLNYVNLSKTTAEFDSILNKNPFLRKSFDQQFIAGLTYTFTYNELVDDYKKYPVFLSTSLDVAGYGPALLSGGKKEVFGLEYAEYAKADIDLRFYLKWGREQVLVTRLYGGWGIPYGHSNTLPFIKQFFSGGPYSVRAFPIRSLGPGSFGSGQGGPSSFYDQSGNLRLEANLEYRFPIWSYLKGAFFADAGNVWLTGDITIPADEPRENRDFNEELFAKGRFGQGWMRQLGIGLGFGLRVDIQSFVLRLDLASPLQVPYLPEGERLKVPFIKGGKDNLELNFAIGYPF